MRRERRLDARALQGQRTAIVRLALLQRSVWYAKSQAATKAHCDSASATSP